MVAHLDTRTLRALEAPLFPAEARVVHDIAGRLRLAVPALRGDRARAEAVRAELERRAAARRVEVNPLTGSIVIEHAPDAATRAARPGRARLPPEGGADAPAGARPRHRGAGPRRPRRRRVGARLGD